MSFRIATRAASSWRRRNEGNIGGQVARAPIGRLQSCTALLLLFVALPCVWAAQDETSSAVSTTSGVSMVAGEASSPAANPKTQAKSAYVTASDGPTVGEANRKALEARAGAQAGKLLIRSVPSGSRVFVNDNYVGHTPLLLIVAPGKYKIQTLGPREESGEKTVDLGPKETREVALTLTARYPDHVATR